MTLFPHIEVFESILCSFWFRVCFTKFLLSIMQLLTWEFDWKYMVRGLVLDKKRGSILKVIYYCFISTFLVQMIHFCDYWYNNH
jgi:hypothetical protein